MYVTFTGCNKTTLPQKGNAVPKSDDKHVPSTPNLTNVDIGESSKRQSPIGFARQMYLQMNEEVCSENKNTLKKYVYFNISPEGFASLFYHFRFVLLYFNVPIKKHLPNDC